MYNNEMSSFFPYHVQCGYHAQHHNKNDVNFRPRLFLIAWFQFDFFNAKDASKGLKQTFLTAISQEFSLIKVKTDGFFSKMLKIED